MTLEQIKKQIQGSAILGALIFDGSISVVYKEPTTDDALIFRSWTIVVLVVDDDYMDQARKALEGLGWDLVQRGDRITCTRDVAITATERKQIAAAEAIRKQAQQQAKAEARHEATRSTIEGLQEQLDELKEDVGVMGLITPKNGVRGPQGTAGQPGRDGQDLLATNATLNDLKDVDAPDPAKGLVLTWTGSRWEPRATQTIASVGGGGGQGLTNWTETDAGHLLPVGQDQTIGSADQPVGELYLKGSTIYLNGLALSLNTGDRLEFDGNQLGYGDGSVTDEELAAVIQQVEAVDTKAGQNESDISQNKQNIIDEALARISNDQTIQNRIDALVSYDDTALAASVTQNATDISTNATGISTNATGISTNATDISTNATAISTNATAISTNATDISTNATAISTNATGISTNATAISTNTTGISTNATDISTNATGISTNATAISTNATDISTNATAISTNATAISTNATDISTNATAISTNATAISTNATGISTNASDISTNATAISTNATAISTKADLVDGVVPTAQIPAIAITEFLGDVADQTEMLALSGQKGDWCNRTDVGLAFVITGTDPTEASSWTDLVYPAAPVTSVNDQTGSVVLSAADVGAATTAQGGLADTALQTVPNHSAGLLTSGTIPDARIADIGDSQARIITFNNLEKNNLTADGELSFDSSQGLLVYRAQQGTDGAATTVLDGWNVAAGTGISITNLGAGNTGTDQFTFSLGNHSADLLTSGTVDTARLPNHSADLLTSGTVDTARLPDTYTKAARVTIQATGTGNDVLLDAANHILLEAGEEEAGAIIFRGNNGSSSYKFSKGGQTAVEGFLSFESLTGDKTFTFPNQSGTIALTSSSISGNAATATKLATARTISISGDVTGTATSFDGSANISISASIPGIDANNLTNEVLFESTPYVEAPAGDGAEVDYQIWHEGNQGALSGLDADLLDGEQGSYYTKRISTTPLTYLADLNSITDEGWYSWGGSSNSPSNSPGDYGVMWMLKDAGQLQQMVQTYGGSANAVKLYGRRKTNGNWDTTWTEYWSTANDGAGSGLNADKLDDLHASSFLVLNTANTVSGNISFTSTTTPITTNSIHFNNVENINYYTEANGVLTFDENFYDDTEYGTGTYDPDTVFTGGDGGGLLIKNSDGWGAIFTSQNTRWASAEWGNLKVGSNQVWHAGNDGAGSGLDADKVDGVEGVAITQSLARFSGWVPGYNTSDEYRITWNYAENAVEIRNAEVVSNSASKQSGAAYKAIKLKAGDTVRINLQAKGSVADSNGFYLRLYFYNGVSLPDGKTHVAKSANHPLVQDEDTQDHTWYENGSITTSYVSYVHEYTAAVDGYLSINILNWSGYEGSIFVKEPVFSISSVFPNQMSNAFGNWHTFVNDGGGNIGQRWNSTPTGSNLLVESGCAFELEIGNDGEGGSFILNRGKSSSSPSSAGDPIAWTRHLQIKEGKIIIPSNIWMNFGADNTFPGYDNTDSGFQVQNDGASGTVSGFISNANNPALYLNRNSNGMVVSLRRSGTQVGHISVTSSQTTYATSSDYRLKENVAPVVGAIERFKSLNPLRFNFIQEPNIVVDGFLAHEVQAVVPEAVTGEKDEVDESGAPVMQGIDQSKLVPLLTAALQAALTKVEQLEARLDAAGL